MVPVESQADLEISDTPRSRQGRFAVPRDAPGASAHRTWATVERPVADPETGEFRAMAGLPAAHRGVVPSRTLRPVVGRGLGAAVRVVPSRTLRPAAGVRLHRGVRPGLLLSAVPIPRGIPVARVGLDAAEKAAPMTTGLLARHSPALAETFAAYPAKGREELPTVPAAAI